MLEERVEELLENINLKELLELRGMDLDLTVKDNAKLISDEFLFVERKKDKTYFEIDLEKYKPTYPIFTESKVQLKPLRIRKYDNTIHLYDLSISSLIYKYMVEAYFREEDEEIKKQCEQFLFVDVENSKVKIGLGRITLSNRIFELKNSGKDITFNNMGYILNEEHKEIFGNKLVARHPKVFIGGEPNVIQDEHRIINVEVKFFEDDELSDVLSIGNKYLNINALPTAVKIHNIHHTPTSHSLPTLVELLELPSSISQLVTESEIGNMEQNRTSIIFSNIDGIYYKDNTEHALGILVKYNEIIYTFNRNIFAGEIILSNIIDMNIKGETLTVLENNQLIKDIDSLGYKLHDETKLYVIKSVLFEYNSSNSLIVLLTRGFKNRIFGKGVNDLVFPFGEEDIVPKDKFIFNNRKPEDLVENFLFDTKEKIKQDERYEEQLKDVRKIIDGIDFGTVNAEDALKELLLYDKNLGKFFRTPNPYPELVMLYMRTAVSLLTPLNEELHIRDMKIFIEVCSEFINGTLLKEVIEKSHEER
jgi:hypothetical protein